MAKSVGVEQILQKTDRLRTDITTENANTEPTLTLFNSGRECDNNKIYCTVLYGNIL